MVHVKGLDVFESMMGVNLSNHLEVTGVAQQRVPSLDDDQGLELKSWPTLVNEIV